MNPPHAIRTRRPLLGLTAVLVTLLVLAAQPTIPAAAADEPSMSAVTSVRLDGFTYIDGTRQATVDTVGWCASADRITLIACNQGDPNADVVEGRSQVHGAVLGFGAVRRVSPSATSTRLLQLEITPTQAGALAVTVDATATDGAEFEIVPGTAVPSSTAASSAAVTWNVPAVPGETLLFSVAYTSDITGAAGADDAIPAAIIALTPDATDVAVTHLRGSLAAPVGLDVRRSELRYDARVVAPTGPPVLQQTPPTSTPGFGRVGPRLTTTMSITGRGDALLGTQPDTYLTYRPLASPARNLFYAASYIGSPDNSIDCCYDQTFTPGEGVDVEAFLGHDSDRGLGLFDGEAAHVPYTVLPQHALNFQAHLDTTEPRNDDGRLVFDWDGHITDALSYVDAYGHLTLASFPEQPPIGAISSIISVERRVEDGDIDRRDVPENGALIPSEARPWDAEFHIEVPEGWDIWRSTVLHSTAVRTRDSMDFNADGSATLRSRVEPGEHWLESRVGPDGYDTWSWPMHIVVVAAPREATDGIVESLPDAYDGLVTDMVNVVPDGEHLKVVDFRRDGSVTNMQLGPGTHTLRSGLASPLRTAGSIR